MNYAIIDMGSNTVRLVVYRYEDGEFSAIINQEEVVGLSGYIKNKRMKREGIKKACEIIRSFREIAVRFTDEDHIHVFATASLRGITNQEQTLEEIQLSTGLLPEALTGEEEARLEFIGASHFTRCENGVLIDIGGASVELVRFQDGNPKKLVSIPIGCLSLYTQFVGKMLPTAKESRKIKKEIQEQFKKHIRWNTKEKPPLLIGIGGTVRAAHKLSGELFAQASNQMEMPTAYIKKILRILKRNESDIYHTVYRKIPERAQTISTGLMILQEAIKLFRCDNLQISDFGVREGYLIDRVLREEEAPEEEINKEEVHVREDSFKYGDIDAEEETTLA